MLIVDYSSTLQLLQTIFLILKIISTIPIPRFESGPFGVPFVYWLYDVLFLICSKMAVDLLENFQVKNLYFQSQFSQYHITLYGTMLLIIKRGLGTFFWV